jgi:hypothetical protein
VARGIAGGLAALVQAELAYHRSNDWTTAEIIFPLEPQDCAITERRRPRRSPPPSRTVATRLTPIHAAAQCPPEIATTASPGLGEARSASFVVLEFPRCRTIDARPEAL